MIATLPALTLHRGGSPLSNQGRMDADGSTEPARARQRGLNDPGSSGSYPVDPVVRVAMLTIPPCSGGRTPGPATPWSTQTWSGSSSG